MSFLKDIFNRLCVDRIKPDDNEINKPNNESISPDITEFIVQEKIVDQECIICLNGFNKNNRVALIKCGHKYHAECLYTWLLKRPVCPLCDEELIIG